MTRPYSISTILLFVFSTFGLSAADMPDQTGKLFDVTFTDLLQGEEYSTVDKSGQRLGTLLVFWSMNCGPCLAEIPELNGLYAEWAPLGLEIIGLPQDERPEKLIDLCRRFGITWPQNYESGPVFQKPLAIEWRVTRTPGFILLDPHGRVIASGFNDPAAALDSAFR